MALADKLNNLASQITGVTQGATAVQNAIKPPPTNQPTATPAAPISFYDGITVVGGRAVKNKTLVWGFGGLVLAGIFWFIVTRK